MIYFISYYKNSKYLELDQSKIMAHLLLRECARSSRSGWRPWPLMQMYSTASSANPAPPSPPPVLSSPTSIEGVLSVELNNPRKRNALSLDLLRALDGALAAAEEDEATRVVVLRSSSAPMGVFSSGHDLRELQAMTPSEQAELFAACADVMVRLETGMDRTPVIAEVDGVATAAGCQLVASCDLAVCSRTSRFATPGVSLGLFCSTPAVPLVRRLASRKHAMELLLTGDFVSAERAREMGLVNVVVDGGGGGDHHSGSGSTHGGGGSGEGGDGLRRTVEALARRIASKSSDAMRIGRAGLRCWGSSSSSKAGGDEQQLREAYAAASRTMVENMRSPDATEGIAAFLEKREPQWRR